MRILVEEGIEVHVEVFAGILQLRDDAGYLRAASEVRRVCEQTRSPQLTGMEWV